MYPPAVPAELGGGGGGFGPPLGGGFGPPRPAGTTEYPGSLGGGPLRRDGTLAGRPLRPAGTIAPLEGTIAPLGCLKLVPGVALLDLGAAFEAPDRLILLKAPAIPSLADIPRPLRLVVPADAAVGATFPELRKPAKAPIAAPPSPRLIFSFLVLPVEAPIAPPIPAPIPPARAEYLACLFIYLVIALSPY